MPDCGEKEETKASPATGGKPGWWLLEVDGDEGVKLIVVPSQGEKEKWWACSVFVLKGWRRIKGFHTE